MVSHAWFHIESLARFSFSREVVCAFSVLIRIFSGCSIVSNMKKLVERREQDEYLKHPSSQQKTKARQVLVRRTISEISTPTRPSKFTLPQNTGPKPQSTTYTCSQITTNKSWCFEVKQTLAGG